MAEPSTTDGLRLWQRFHVRLSVMYGGLVLAVLLSVAGFFYLRGVERELTALQARLKIAAMTLAASITADDVAAIRTPADVDGPTYQRLAARFRAVAEAEPDFSDLYVMRRGPRPDALEIVIDVVIRADAAAGLPGEAYPLGRATAMVRGFERPTVEDTPYRDAWGNVLSGYAPIRDGGGAAVAIVGVDVRATRLAAIKREAAVVALAVLAIALVALVVLAMVVARSVRTPLARMVEATNAIASGQLQVRAGLHRSDEFGVVGRRFDEMAHGLEEREFIKATFGQYVSPELVERMLVDRSQAVRGQRRHAAVMFVDVRRFTTLAEGLAPEEVVALLNDYLDQMTTVITRHGGRIDKFIGDAIMADWGSLDDGAAPEAAAVAAALAMLAALATWNRARIERGAAPVEVGIAIHAGDVVAGSIGSARKLEYTVIGDAVNVASRLEGLCKTFGARLVASGTLVAAAGAQARARWLDTLVLRGRAEPTEVYELLTDDDPRHATLADYRAAVALVRAGDRPAAHVALTALAARGPDAAVAYHLERIDEITPSG
ncbi:MAG: adenylate/guanylate cyclase domain-containing protein [Myxococcales bacterium]|nr:adenylate/guanylate cyclase domain-containing protein [Myxococcales bacterium]